jgi:hypothetical protein
MVDATTLIVISTIVQTVVISSTLIVFILQFRSQERAIKESSNQGLMSRYNDLVSSLADKPDLAFSLFSAIDLSGEAARKATKEDAIVFTHLLLAYGIIEEAFILYKKKWIGEEDWQQWSAFLEGLLRHPLFSVIHRITLGTFDKRFEAYISNVILAKKNKMM